MEFSVLGDLRIVANGRPLPLGSPKQRTLTALLLVKTNAVVGPHQIAEELWGDSPPMSATANLRTYVSRLRAALPSAERPRLMARPHGFRLCVDPGELDLSRFEECATNGRRALEEGAVEEALRQLDIGLSLFRGPLVEDVISGPGLGARAIAIEERHLSAEEDRCAAYLSLGRAHDAIGRLRPLVSAQPLRERCWALLMRALYAAHDPAGAIEAYTAARTGLLESLGIEPGAELRDLYRAILRHDPSLGGERGRIVVRPRQLPPVPQLVGRDAELSALAEQLDRPGSLVIVHGPAGIGKSALAVHAAQLSSGSYPDGVLHADLRHRVRPEDALAGLIRSLGATPEPDHLDAHFRSLLTDRRVLVVLDNAADAAQIRPLLTSDPRCAVLLTSWQPLSTLDGSWRLRLRELSDTGSVALLAMFVEPGRLEAEPFETARLVQLCGRQPLALRIAAARLHSHPSWRVTDLVDRLCDQTSRLDELESGDLSVRTCLRTSYDALSSGGRRTDQLAAKAFCVLGVMPAAGIGAAGVAAALDVSRAEATRALDHLVEHALIDQDGRDSYRLPTLPRLLAIELSATDGP